MRNKRSSKNILKTAIRFARMYGVAETLCPVRYLKEEEFFTLICQWTKEYLTEEINDPVAFFERKIKKFIEGP